MQNDRAGEVWPPAAEPLSRVNPGQALPAGLASLMRTDLPALVEEIANAIEASVAEYDRAPAAGARPAIQRAVKRALEDFVGRGAGGSDAGGIYRAIGRAELRAGHSLDALHSACWLGARLAWKRWSTLASVAGVGGSDVCGIADRVLASVDELAGYARDGYMTEAAVRSVDRPTRRRLLKLLLADPPASSAALSAAAAAAGWSMPQTAAVVVLQPSNGPGSESGAAPGAAELRGAWQRIGLPPEVLSYADGEYFLVVPVAGGPLPTDTAGSWVPPGWQAVAGPAMPLRALRSSYRSAVRCLDLIRRGAIGPPLDGTVLAATAHLGEVILLGDEDLLGALIDQYLLPLRQLTDKQQTRIVETLLAWLSAGRHYPAAATGLGVHPQTVRYRIRNAKRLFGPAVLYDAAAEPDLGMALRAWQLMRSARLPAPSAPPVEDMPGNRDRSAA